MIARAAALALVLLGPPCLGPPAWAQDAPLVRSESVVRMVLQEASREPYAGLVAIAAVALDRVEDRRWPGTEDGVVRQPRQFTGMSLRLRRYSQWQIRQARAAVLHARAGYRPCGHGVLWYHASWMRRFPGWSRVKLERCRIGKHVFYVDRPARVSK